jgi:predicted nucleic-acid-binding protein
VIAVDTNVVVRILTDDDPVQVRRARALFERETIFIPKTVMIEAEWVLRRAFRLPQKAVIGSLTRLAGLPNVQCEGSDAVIEALGWAAQGMDFADALHLASSRDADGFATFDGDLMKQARRTAGMRVISP